MYIKIDSRLHSILFKEKKDGTEVCYAEVITDLSDVVTLKLDKGVTVTTLAKKRPRVLATGTKVYFILEDSFCRSISLKKAVAEKNLSNKVKSIRNSPPWNRKDY